MWETDRRDLSPEESPGRRSPMTTDRGSECLTLLSRRLGCFPGGMRKDPATNGRVLRALRQLTASQAFFSSCPPKPLRIADSALSAKSSRPLEAKRE